MVAGASSLRQRVLALALAAPAPVKTDHPVLQRLSEIYNRSNVRGYWRGVFVRTNSLTLRGPEYASRPPVDAFRIAIGGDSRASTSPRR
jgi:hypothetical protein